jgi:hypothetical protein
MTSHSTDFINSQLEAWHAYVKTKLFDEARQWAKKDEQLDQSLWEMFSTGWNAALAQPAQEPVADRLERLLWEYIDLQAAHPEHRPDLKTWPHLMIYAPPLAQEPVECLDCGSNNVGFPATYDSLVNSK